MKIDSTITFAVIIATMALITPVITTWINRKYDHKMKVVELQKDYLSKHYSRSFDTFQNFITNSGNLLIKIDGGKTPSKIEIQKFETSCLKCFLFLSEEDRESFQEFRIIVKKELGFSDPRGMSVMQATILPFLQATRVLSALATPENEIYSSFNKCIAIANETLQQAATKELLVLSELDKKNKSGSLSSISKDI